MGKSSPKLKTRASQMAQWVKNLPAIQKTQETWVWSVGQEDTRGGHGNPLQYSYLENLMDRGAWWVTVYRVAKSQTRLERLMQTWWIYDNCEHWDAESWGPELPRKSKYTEFGTEGKCFTSFTLRYLLCNESRCLGDIRSKTPPRRWMTA